MPKNKTGKTPKKQNKQENPSLRDRLDHYQKGHDDMEMRKTRKSKGFDAIIDAYMSKLPGNWPYTSRVTDPRIRTTILEKTARLLNAKLQGRLVPREGTDVTKARINNAILEFQWDRANKGGSMIEKVAKADMVARLFGASFVLNYWDNDNDCNEMKVIDPRDIFLDPSADHIRNARWVQVREFTTIHELEARGYNVKHIKEKITEKYSATRDDLSQVKENRGLEERLGQDPANPVIELVTEWTAKEGNQPSMRYVFLPKYNEMLEEGENPYIHGLIPVSQLRYYPLLDDIYGESEVEPVISLQRAINAVLCGFIDTMNLAMRPPVKILTGETRQDTIEYGPGARWILNNINSGQEVNIGDSAIKAFNNTYPALVAAFNTAMGDQSLGTSNIGGGGFEKKTATEVASLERQQTTRDQYNQLYLAEFLKDMIMQWLSNNKQYLFDDPTKKFRVVKIVGKEAIQNLQQMGIHEMDLPQDAMNEIADAVMTNQVSQTQLDEIIEGVQVPRNPVIKNPTADSPDEYDIVRKLEVNDNGMEAELYLTPDDMEGVYDYVPDVKSMAAGAGLLMQQGRRQALEFAKDQQVQQNLASEGKRLKMSELLPNVLEDAGYRDADSLIESIEQGQAAVGGGQLPLGATQQPGLQAPPNIPLPDGGLGMAGPEEVQAAGVPELGVPV